ncbi:MAG: acyltransferase family protein [Firmicutes bacterium]|nr:acyltransferase family protein [Bacillota bacterium]
MEIQSGGRKEYLDIAKGIGILLMVLAHCPLVYNPIKQWIYSFHMPLFFFVAGMVWNKPSHEKRGFFTWKFLYDKVLRLIIPCFIWGIVYLIIDAVMKRSFSPRYFAYLVYGSQAGFRKAGSLSSLWFLPCMFLSVCAFEVIQQTIAKLKRGIWVLCCVSVVFAVAGLFLPRLSNGYPWSTDVAFLGVTFMMWGYLTKNAFETEAKKENLTALLLLIGLLALSLTCFLNLPYVSTNNVDMAGRHTGNPLLYLFNAAAGSALVLFLSVFLCRIQKLAAFCADLGRKTIPILVLHKPIVRVLNRMGEMIGVPSAISVILSVAAAVGASLLVYWVVRKILPIAFGEKPKKPSDHRQEANAL